MKLYELPRRSDFLIVGDPDERVYYLDHLDGAYSYCLDEEHNLVHLSVNTPVIIYRACNEN